jgi:hypothetical protein
LTKELLSGSSQIKQSACSYGSSSVGVCHLRCTSLVDMLLQMALMLIAVRWTASISRGWFIGFGITNLPKKPAAPARTFARAHTPCRSCCRVQAHTCWQHAHAALLRLAAQTVREVVVSLRDNTLVALCLCFSLHCVFPSPIYFLDEVRPTIYAIPCAIRPRLVSITGDRLLCCARLTRTSTRVQSRRSPSTLSILRVARASRCSLCLTGLDSC